MTIIDIGTVAILSLGAASILIRARHFCHYGREALLIVALYLITAGLLRASSGRLADTETTRALTGLAAIGFLGVQGFDLLLAEWTHRSGHKT